MLSRRVSIMKFSRVISRVRWFSLVEANVWKTISVLVLRVVEIIWVGGQPSPSIYTCQSSILRAVR
jgi:hypothetical protein